MYICHDCESDLKVSYLVLRNNEKVTICADCYYKKEAN